MEKTKNPERNYNPKKRTNSGNVLNYEESIICTVYVCMVTRYNLLYMRATHRDTQ